MSQLNDNLEDELLVRQSDEKLAQFDVQRITEALMRESKITPEIANHIALEVKEQIRLSGIQALTGPLIRGLVDAKLLERGLIAAHRLHARLGVPMFDADQIIQGVSTELKSGHGPEATSFALAEAIKREYAMLNVFSEQVVNAHLAGDIHIENLGEVDRLTTLVGSVDFIKRNGVVLPGGYTGSRPAKHPEVLALHLVKYTAALHGYFSEAIAWDSVNYAFAPLLENLTHEERKQVAQTLLFELSTPAIARGGQPMRCDLHLDWDAPNYLRERRAVGPGGEQLEKTYDDYGDIARDFLVTLFEVYFEGDGQGLPLTGARLVLHVTSRFVDSVGYRSFLDLASRVAAGRGGITFNFDRSPTEDATLSAFTKRYGMDPALLNRASESWQWRSALFSSVAINLPRIARRSDNDQVKVFESIREALELVAQASLEKRVFIEKLLSRGESGVLALLAVRPNNEPLLRLNWTAHAICPLGLSEIAEQITGQSLEKSKETQAFAERLIHHLHEEVERLSLKHKVRFMLAESHDTTASVRLAKLDGATQSYSNAAKISSEKPLTALERLRIEGDWQQDKIFGAFTELMDSEIEMSAEQMAVLISRAFYQTGNAALTFAVSYSICLSCREVTKGVHDSCEKCGSSKIDILAQRDGYFSRITA